MSHSSYGSAAHESVHAWSTYDPNLHGLYLVKDIDILENIQKVATNLVPELRKTITELVYKSYGLTTLKGDYRSKSDCKTD